jgi:hypothetical protein
MHLCVQDDQNGQKMMVLPSAEKARLTHFILSKNIFSSKQPSLTADGNTIMNLPWYPRKIVHFSLDFYGGKAQPVQALLLMKAN